MRSHDFLANAEALAKNDGADKACNTGVDVNNRTAGKVDGAPVEQPTIGSVHSRTIVSQNDSLCGFVGCRCQLGQEVRGGAVAHGSLDHVNVVRAQGKGVRSCPPPDHVGHGQIGEREPDKQEKQNRRKFHALGKSADNKRRSNGRKCQLEDDIGEFRQVGFLGEGCRQR